MENNSNQNGSRLLELIVAVIVIAALVFVFKYIWFGITWAFGQYVNLLGVH